MDKKKRMQGMKEEEVKGPPRLARWKMEKKVDVIFWEQT